MKALLKVTGELANTATLTFSAGQTSQSFTVAVTPDGGRAVSASWKTLKVWDLETGRALRTLSLLSKIVVLTTDQLYYALAGPKASRFRYQNPCRIFRKRRVAKN